MSGLTIEPYAQHDWSTTTWALMLTVMVTAVVAAMALFLVMAGRAKGVPGQRRRPRT